MWEIMKYFRVDGENLKMWRGRDAEGRKIYIVSELYDEYTPNTFGYYTQKAALANYLEYKELYAE